MKLTPLELARIAMEADPEDAHLRLAFFARLADTELFMLMEEAPDDAEALSPQVFAVDGGHVVLVFDSEERLADFAGGAAPYAALPGRGLAAWLAGEAVGIGVNLTDDGEGTLLPPEALDWLAQTLEDSPAPAVREDLRPDAVLPPAGLPEALLPALEAKLARAGGLAAGAVLAGVRYAGGGRGHLLALFDPAPGAEPALARAVQEALVFSGIDAGTLDVVFPPATGALADRLRAAGLRIDLPPPAEPDQPPAPPGSDPERPPKLR